MGAIYLPGRAVVHGLPMEARRLLAEAARAAGLALREPIAVSDWQALPSGHPARPLGPVMARLGIRASVTVPIGRAEAPPRRPQPGPFRSPGCGGPRRSR
jgi:hypothetical protein